MQAASKNTTKPSGTRPFYGFKGKPKRKPRVWVSKQVENRIPLDMGSSPWAAYCPSPKSQAVSTKQSLAGFAC